MAEPLSVVASGMGVAAFALQLAQSVTKIKKFCADVKNAPGELQEILDQIENISTIMARLGREETHSPSSSMNEDILQGSLQICQKAVDRISALASDLQDEMKSRRLRTSVRTVLKQDTIEKMLAKLDRSKTDLHIAYSMYTDARRMKELENLRRCIGEMRDGQIQMMDYTRTVSMHHPEAEDKNMPNPKRRHSTRRKAMECSQTLHIQLPRWLCQYAWDVAFVRASGCWTVSLRSFRVLGNDRAIWDVFYEDDVDGIRDLLDRRQLSIHDQTGAGRTLASVGPT